MFGARETNLYEVTYNTGSKDKTKTISCPKDEGKPSKGKALQKLDDPTMMMVPREDIQIKSIRKVKEDESGGMSYY
jgi:hypothetical protein